MKQYKKAIFKRNQRIKLIITLVIAAGILGTVFYGLNLYAAIGNFALDSSPDPSSFKKADPQFLLQIAEGLDDRYAPYHLILNQSTSTYFKNDSKQNNGVVSYSNVSAYSFSDNEALWTGIDYAGWTYKYLVAIQEQNKEMEDFSLNVLLNMTTGLTLLMEVPNGGIGPNYNAILARGVAPPYAQDIWPYIFTDAPKHFNGTGIYSQWRYRAYTSNDEYAGYYLFLAIATKYLQNVAFIQERVSLIVDQLCINWIYTNLLGIHGSGGTTGVDEKASAFSGGFWAPLIFKLGAIYYPEKYERYYYQFIANEMYYLSASESGSQETFANYYAYNFGACVCFAFLLLENPQSNVWNTFFQGFYKSLWTNVRYHRNAWVNAIFLTILYEAKLSTTVTNENLTLISQDVGDQLMRFGETHYPNYNYLMNVTLPAGYHLMKPVQNFVNTLGLDSQMQRLLGIDGEEEFLNKPMTVDYYDVDGWCWNNNPYSWRLDTNENLLLEHSGSSFTVPYWMLRYCTYLNGGVS
jgi:hypothetical protein